MGKRYEELGHTADVRFRIYGADERELFSNAAFALFDKMVDLSAVRPSEAIEVEVSGADVEEMLVNFLSEILYRFDAEKFVARECEIKELSPGGVKSVCRGEKFDPAKHEFRHHIKAVTFHDVRIENTPDGLAVTITCDV